MKTGSSENDSRPLFHVLADARARLIDAGIPRDEAAIDVDVYARTILGWDRARLIAEHHNSAPSNLEPQFSEWIARRERREPTAYIIGMREFWGLDFIVTPAVLIPRPETEFIVEEALRVADAETRGADIGTGSGCVAIALAHEQPGCRIVASDLSAGALQIARANAIRHAVGDRVTFVMTSYLDGLAGPFDLITANPPYVKDRDKPALAPAVRHEPDLALFGGDEGLRDIAGVLDAAATKLRRGGWLFLEFGYGQEDDVRELIARQPQLRLVRVRSDLQGIPRTAIIQHA